MMFKLGELFRGFLIPEDKLRQAAIRAEIETEIHGTSGRMEGDYARTKGRRRSEEISQRRNLSRSVDL